MSYNLSSDIKQNCPNDEQSLSSLRLRFSPMITILIYIIYLLPFCFGVFGNISVCLIFFQQKKLRSITNTFLMNLCLNDLIVLCVSIPMTLSSALINDWIFGEFLCKFINFAPTLTALVSTFTVAIIAVERWLFIVNKRKFDRRCTIITLITLWMISILIALPEYISRDIKEFAPLPISYPMLNTNHSNETIHDEIQLSCPIKKFYFCLSHPGIRMRIFSYIIYTVQYLVPFLFVSVSCYSISRYLKRRMKQMRTYQNNRPKHCQEREPKPKIRRLPSNGEEVTENEYPSYDEIPANLVSNESKSNLLLTRFKNTFQNSLIVEKRSYRSASVVNTVLMPTVKSQSHSERRFHRSRKLLICVAALFTLSWLPLTVVQIYLEHNEEITLNEPNFVYAFLLIPCYLISSLSAWMNPVIYNYINRSFRREFYALYPCCCHLTRRSSSALPSASSMSRINPSTMRGKHSEKLFKKEADESQVINRANSARFVKFAEPENNDKPSIVVINEHV